CPGRLVALPPGHLMTCPIDRRRSGRASRTVELMRTRHNGGRSRSPGHARSGSVPLPGIPTQALCALEQEAAMLVRFSATVLVASLIVVPRANADEPESGVLRANIAVDAAVTVSSETTDHPARLATDGDAATMWCPQTVPGSLTVDLGSVRGISGFGINLAGA